MFRYKKTNRFSHVRLSVAALTQEVLSMKSIEKEATLSIYHFHRNFSDCQLERIIRLEKVVKIVYACISRHETGKFCSWKILTPPLSRHIIIVVFVTFLFASLNLDHDPPFIQLQTQRVVETGDFSCVGLCSAQRI